MIQFIIYYASPVLVLWLGLIIFIWKFKKPVEYKFLQKLDTAISTEIYSLRDGKYFKLFLFMWLGFELILFVYSGYVTLIYGHFIHPPVVAPGG
jgi:hypothetical protein